MATELNVRMSKADQAFSTKGFCNWKKAVLKFKEHECSHTHQHAVVIHAACQRPSNQQLQKAIDRSSTKLSLQPSQAHLSCGLPSTPRFSNQKLSCWRFKLNCPTSNGAE